ncbi:MAG TPA: hypothetical protein VHG51_13670, partial [Longimicrobiaceae bacterium]|nr:hypothetical protein [Longimicrobiaceae bacterium]
GHPRPAPPMRPSAAARRLALCAAGLLAGLAAPAASQEVGVFASGARSDQLEMRRPLGLGAYVAVSPVSFLKVRLSYQEQAAREDRLDTVCDTYWPEFRNCVGEGVRSEGRMRTVSGLLLGVVPVGRRVRLEAGAGRSRTRVELDLRSDSGRGLGVVVPEGEEQRGVVLHAGAALERVLGTPLGAMLEAERRQVDFEGCVMDVGAPFCGTSRFHELRVGLRYRFL